MVAVALVAAPASAKTKAKVYRGTFSFVGADGDYIRGNFGKLQLVDGKRNDKLSVHVRRLAPRTTYTYRLQKGSCKEGASGGTAVAGWRYRSLKTSRKGTGNATARSRTFTARKGVKYFVGVYDAAGDQIVVCAQLRTNGHKGHAKPHRPAKPAKPTKPAKRTKPAKHDDAPRGKGQHKPRG